MLLLSQAIRAVQHVVYPKIGITSPILKEYQVLLDTVQLRPAYIAELDLIIGRLIPGQTRYQLASTILGNGIPWWFIAITHFMEIGHAYPNHFQYHLHCGDPLTGRTTHVPKGRPVHNPGGGTEQPSKDNPYGWQESAVDALTYMGYNKIKDWSIPNCMFLFEKFNGGGYKKRHINSPYVWSYTNHYGVLPHTGKYLADGKFSSSAISKQPGTAAIYLRMKEKGLITG